MSVADRKKHLRIVSEMLLVHLPNILDDQSLGRDLLTVVALAIRAAAEDAEKSATAWDKRAYHLKADRLRQEWLWAPGAANYAAGLADRPHPISAKDLKKLRALIDVELEHPKRLHYKDPTAFRGTRQATEQRERQKGHRAPKRSLV